MQDTRTPELLIDVTRLKSLPPSSRCIVDCRFNLAEPSQGREQWVAGHIPGAAYADLDRDLAGPVTAASGRHPLPDPLVFAAFLSRAGWQPGMRIIAYDAQGGAFAARLWWLMRYFGNDCVSLLNGGLAAWIAAKETLEAGEIGVDKGVTGSAPRFVLTPDHDQVLTVGEVQSVLNNQSALLLDARDAGRFAGRNETIDPVAGHVPGALNRPFTTNLSDDGTFRDRQALSEEFLALGGEHEASAGEAGAVVHMCGSGITACHNAFAMALAGLGDSKLYAGSWSEWIRDTERPVATGRP